MQALGRRRYQSQGNGGRREAEVGAYIELVRPGGYQIEKGERALQLVLGETGQGLKSQRDEEQTQF